MTGFGTRFRVFGIPATVLFDALVSFTADETKEIAYSVIVPIAARNMLRIFCAIEVLVGEEFAFSGAIEAHHWCQYHRCTAFGLKKEVLIFLWENLLAAS